jgi:hypothetical protein
MHLENRPTPEALEARLRALPSPPVPGGLEARLLAGIPAEVPIARRRWPVWVGVGAAAAAACVLAVLAWLGHDKGISLPDPQPSELVHKDTPRLPDEFVAPPEIVPTFHWPLEDTSPLTVSIAIPPELFE